MMKKKYQRPSAEVLAVSTAQMLAVSGNFTEGETTTVGIYPDDDIDGGSAWAHRHDVWGDNEY